jgi:DNA-binding response OmpR family regulator
LAPASAGLADTAEDQHTGQVEERSMNPDKYRVLAFDDEKDILELIKITLSPHFEVVVHSDSSDAKEIMDIVEPDIVIVDIMMPKVTGYHIIEEIRNDSRTSTVPIVILSAKDTARDQKLGYKLGANIYLTKPFQPERLLKNVQTMLATNVAGHARKKMLSLRDVQLRMQMHAAKPVGIPDDIAAKQGEENTQDTSSFKLKRPLAHQEMKRKEWLD